MRVVFWYCTFCNVCLDCTFSCEAPAKIYMQWRTIQTTSLVRGRTTNPYVKLCASSDLGGQKYMSSTFLSPFNSCPWLCEYLWWNISASPGFLPGRWMVKQNDAVLGVVRFGVLWLSPHFWGESQSNRLTHSLLLLLSKRAGADWTEKDKYLHLWEAMKHSITLFWGHPGRSWACWKAGLWGALLDTSHPSFRVAELQQWKNSRWH